MQCKLIQENTEANFNYQKGRNDKISDVIGLQGKIRKIQRSNGDKKIKNIFKKYGVFDILTLKILFS